MKIRQVAMSDVQEISTFLEKLSSLGKRTSPSDPDFVRSHYIEHPDNIQCAVAEDEHGAILGFQILKIATKGNIYGVDVGWGIIGTHVKPDAARQGVGKALFMATRKAALNASIQKIDATISAENSEGLAYYDAIGFRTYRAPDGKVCKCFEMTAKTAIFPPGSKNQAAQVKVSPGIISGHHVFLTGTTGSLPDGSMPETAEDQFRSAFNKIGSVLSEANLAYDSIVEMTSYHVGIHDHFELFNEIRCEYVSDPFPAWTAVEVAGLRRAGAIVEIRIIASLAS